MRGNRANLTTVRPPANNIASMLPKNSHPINPRARREITNNDSVDATVKIASQLNPH